MTHHYTPRNDGYQIYRNNIYIGFILNEDDAMSFVLIMNENAKLLELEAKYSEKCQVLEFKRRVK
jgi:hypothetical protein